MAGESAKVSRSFRRADDCLRAELKMEFWFVCQRELVNGPRVGRTRCTMALGWSLRLVEPISVKHLYLHLR